MIIGWIRWGVILFVGLTIIYGILTLTHRSKEKDRLKARYTLDGSDLSEKDFVTLGMAKYAKSLRAKLILGVYCLPLIIFGVLTYLAHV